MYMYMYVCTCKCKSVKSDLLINQPHLMSLFHARLIRERYESVEWSGMTYMYMYVFNTSSLYYS